MLNNSRYSREITGATSLATEKGLARRGSGVNKHTPTVVISTAAHESKNQESNILWNMIWYLEDFEPIRAINLSDRGGFVIRGWRGR